jgi:hypothetical protein
MTNMSEPSWPHSQMAGHRMVTPRSKTCGQC